MVNIEQVNAVWEGFNYERRPKPTWEDRKIDFDAYKIFYNTDVFETEALKIVTNVRKNFIN